MALSDHDIVILPFDFKNEELINSALDLLNDGTEKRKHTRAYWDWRFEENPFGPSLGWYAKDQKKNKMAAVLLWWPWKYRISNASVLFYQAINGKTDAEYRNLGIFYKLNNVAISYFSERNIPLYGVPNSKSYPSYVKLEWITLSSVQPYYILVSPLNSVFKYLGKRGLDGIKSQFINLGDIIFTTPDYPNNVLYTVWDKETLEWRFINHPVFNYSYFSLGGKLIIYKIKNRSNFIEAQVVLSTITDFSEIRIFIKHLMKQSIDLISYYGYNTKFATFFKRKLVKYKLKKTLYFVINDNRYSGNIKFRLELAEMDTQ